MVKNSLLIGISGALLTGMIIGVQATLSNRGGNIIGPIRTGMLTNLGSGIFAILFIVITMIWRTVEWRNLPNPTLGMLLFSGGLGVLIVIGVSFSLRYTGVTAGSAALILGQLLISMVVDAMGWSGQEVVPVTWQRVLGILVMAIGVYLLMPKDK
jgi:transporter family-2 protein